ncbi:MAG: UrcA family protein [Steroidobacteraceae bacterium]
MNRILARCLVAASLVTPVALPAATEAPTQTVRVTDLDLSQSRDVGILYQRLKFAAAAVCPTTGRDTARAARARACQEAVLDRTVSEARLPQLTAFHRERAGGREARLAQR